MTCRLALDHITVMDARPLDLVEAASAADCAGICLFMESMAVLPHMPHFDLFGSATARAELKAILAGTGVSLDLAYPFTLTGRTDVEAYRSALDLAAELGAQCVNLLIYDRDESRRADNFGAFCDLAGEAGLKVALEFYPVSQVRSLAEALPLVALLDRPGRVGVNVDLLHLMRSGGNIAELAAAPPGSILFAQIADGPRECVEDSLDVEASSRRWLAGEGVFDVAGFVRALPDGCPISVEIPQEDALLAGLSRTARARRAVESVRAALRD
jgi:sugar phosphate isomerase/epimerase